MVAEASPFRPGMGRVPPAMSGRDEVLARYQAWFATKNSHGEVAIVEGHHGVGKTSLLKVVGAQAAQQLGALANTEEGILSMTSTAHMSPYYGRLRYGRYKEEDHCHDRPAVG